MQNDFLKDEKGNSFMPVGVQAHNSSTGTPLLQKAIKVVKAYGGNCLEAPVYWYRLEPEAGRYDMSLVRGLIDEARQAGLRLSVLWFAASKNGHPNYAPEYIKCSPGKYLLAKGPDGAPVASLSPHCMETLERDRMAFEKLMAFLKEYDKAERTVVAVQIENEMGYANTDMDYSEYVLAEYQKEVPECLTGVRLEDSGVEDLREGEMSPWKRKFGRHSHEAFSAWHHARYIDNIAQAGKQIYDLPMLTGVLSEHHALRLNTAALTLQLIVFAKSHVKRSVINLSIVWLFHNVLLSRKQPTLTILAHRNYTISMG